MRRLALFGFALAFLAAGCGGGGGSQLSKEEYISQLDQICEDFNAKQDEIGEPQSLEDLADKGPQIQEEFGNAIERIHDLGKPPEEIAADANRFVEVSEEQRDLIDEIVEAAADNDLQRAQEIAERGGTLQSESDQLANGLGAANCSD